jgi:ketosteroid isomerase-like protein
MVVGTGSLCIRQLTERIHPHAVAASWLKVPASWILADSPVVAYRRSMVKTNTATDVVRQYSEALAARDFSAARALLADNLRFEGPIDQFDRADDYVKAISGLFAMVKGIEPQAIVADGENVAVFYVLQTVVANAPVAEWYTVREGKIVQLRAYFDARPFAAQPGQAGH